jgi:XTP/dITP diphosphohydrolase
MAVLVFLWLNTFFMELVFVTSNAGKKREIENLLGKRFSLKSLDDLGFEGDIPEVYPTLEENASAKAFYIFERFSVDCFADDTGLEVEYLNNMPGVYSARFAEIENNIKYSGKEELTEANISKLLNLLEGKNLRKARFRTVIALILRGKEFRFDGVVNGNITEKRMGEGGFGYDPVFVPDGYKKTFAEMSLEEKNKISHRAIAFGKLVDFLKGRRDPFPENLKG